MDAYDIQRIKHDLNSEVVRRMLIQYFVKKGFSESFDRLLYPATLQDLPLAIPELFNKIEVIPHAQNIDSLTDSAKIGWNLFVLGSQNMYLGETHHQGLANLAQMIQTGQVVAENSEATRQTTPRRVIHFITNVLNSVKGGYIDLTPRITAAQMDMANRISSNIGMSNQFFTKSGVGT